MCEYVAPAIPDFNWTHATDAIIDKDYFAIVTVQVRMHTQLGIDILHFWHRPPQRLSNSGPLEDRATI